MSNNNHQATLSLILKVLSGNILHHLGNVLSRAGLREKGAQQTISQMILAYDDARELLKKHNIHGDNAISDQEIEKLMKKSREFKEDAQRMEAYIAKNLQSFNRIFNQDPHIPDPEICSMLKCVEILFDHYPFPENTQTLVHWDEKDFDFMGDSIVLLKVLFDLLNCALIAVQRAGQGEVFIHAQETPTENILIFKITANSNEEPELDYAKRVMTDLAGQLTILIQEDDGMEIGLHLPKIASQHNAS